MKSHRRCDDWSRLAGAKIEIHRHGHLVRAGIVDAVMPDDTILWLAADHNRNRELFEAAAGYEVWADPQDLPDELCSLILCRQPTTALVSDTDFIL